jgi:putative transposase
LIKHIKIKDFQEAVQIVDDYIHFYNHDRIHLKTKLTPLELRRQFV